MKTKRLFICVLMLVTSIVPGCGGGGSGGENPVNPESQSELVGEWLGGERIYNCDESAWVPYEYRVKINSDGSLDDYNNNFRLLCSFEDDQLVCDGLSLDLGSGASWNFDTYRLWIEYGGLVGRTEYTAKNALGAVCQSKTEISANRVGGQDPDPNPTPNPGPVDNYCSVKCSQEYTICMADCDRIPIDAEKKPCYNACDTKKRICRSQCE